MKATITRRRLSRDAFATLAGDLIRLAEQFQPIGVRGLFYQAVVAGLVDKTEGAYDQVQRIVRDARVNGNMPYEWITDQSRECDHVSTFADVGDVLEAASASFRLDPWRDQPDMVQVWVEKEGLAPLIGKVTRELRVPLYPGKGYSSLTFTREGALQAIAALEAGKAVHVAGATERAARVHRRKEPMSNGAGADTVTAQQGSVPADRP